MKVEIHSNDNGSGANTLLTVMGDYNPQNKVFNKILCTIEESDFLDCFCEKWETIFNKMQKGQIVFDVPKEKLLDKAKTIYR